MTPRLKLKPGQKGTKRLIEQYSDALVSVRYRYDEQSRSRVKTVEIIVERKEWPPPQPKFAAEDVVPVRIAYAESANKLRRRKVGPSGEMWFIPYSKIKGTALEKHIILDASLSGIKKKSI